MHEMKEPRSTFLVETYVARGGEAHLVGAWRRVRAAAAELRHEGVRAQLMCVHFVPEDETSFYVFTGRSKADVAELCRRAAIVCDRIVESISHSGEHPFNHCRA